MSKAAERIEAARKQYVAALGTPLEALAKARLESAIGAAKAEQARKQLAIIDDSVRRYVSGEGVKP